MQDEEVITLFTKAAEKLGIEQPVEAVRVVRDPASNLGKGFGFILFSSQAAARAALSLDGAKLRNREVRVTKAVKVPAHLKDANKGSNLRNNLPSYNRSKLAGAAQQRDSSKQRSSQSGKLLSYICAICM